MTAAVLRRVKFDRNTGGLDFGNGLLRNVGDYEQLLLHVSDLEGVTAANLQEALRHVEDRLREPVAEVSVGDVDRFDETFSAPSVVGFSWDDASLYLYCTFDSEHWDDLDDPPPVASIGASLLARFGLSVHDVVADLEWWSPAGPARWRIRLSTTRRTYRVSALWDAGDALVALLRAVDGGPIGLSAAKDLVLSGHATALLGGMESDWLEVKSQEYDLTSRIGKINLAQTVARFCNGTNEGLIVIGVKTRKVGDTEFLSALAPIPTDPKRVARYLRVLDDHLVPLPLGLEIKSVQEGDGELVSIFVPRQPAELRPFLVHGAVVDGRTFGTFFSLVQRRGDISVPVTAAAVQNQIAVGRALLRQASDAKNAME